MTAHAQSARAFEELLAQRVLVLDGAMGTMLQQQHLSAEDFGGSALEGCNENLVRTRPDVVLEIHRAYLAAGRGYRGNQLVRRSQAGAGGVRPGR